MFCSMYEYLHVVCDRLQKKDRRDWNVKTENRVTVVTRIEWGRIHWGGPGLIMY